MTSVGRAAVVSLFLAALAAAAPFEVGTRFGTLGLDRGYTSAFAPELFYDRTPFATLDPYFRTGIAVMSDFVVGAELALLNTLPGDNGYGSTPVLAFGPSAVYHLLPNGDLVRPSLAAGAGATYGFAGRRVGWRARRGGGAMLTASPRTAFGIEAGWYSDWYRWMRRYRGDTIFLGLRIMVAG